MNPGRFCRRAVALAAAYALALQVLLLAFVPTTPASIAALCTHEQAAGGAATGGHHPAGGDVPCAAFCAALAQGIAGPVPQIAIVAARPVQVTAAVVAVRDWRQPATAFHRPQSPRAPPVA